MRKPIPSFLAGGVFCLAATLVSFAQTAKPAAAGASKSQVAHGEYLVKSIAGCPDCHTPMNEKGEPEPGQG